MRDVYWSSPARPWGLRVGIAVADEIRAAHQEAIDVLGSSIPNFRSGDQVNFGLSNRGGVPVLENELIPPDAIEVVE